MTWARSLRSGCLFVAMFGGAVAHAQIVTTTPVVPSAQYNSPGAVDMRTGEYVAQSADLSIGSEQGGLTFVRVPERFKLFSSNWHYKVSKRPKAGGGYYYQIENRAIAKTWYSYSGATYQEVGLSDGMTTLQRLGSGPYYFLFTAADGTTTRFQTSSDGTNTWAEEIKRPDGLTYTLSYDSGGPSGTRLRRVSSNTGYQLILEYFASPNNGKISKVCAINAAVTTPPALHVCPVGARSVSYTYSGDRVASVTNAAGATSTITNTYVNSTTNFQESFYKPGIAQPWLTNFYANQTGTGLVHVTQQNFAGGRTLTYVFELIGRGDPPFGAVPVGVSWTENGQNSTLLNWGYYQANVNYLPAVTPGPVSVSDPLVRTTETTFDDRFAKILTVSQPSGRTATYTYGSSLDSRPLQIQHTPSTGYSDPASTVGYTYASGINKNRPATATDARGNTTDYTYDPTHGGVLTETLPAPTAGAVRPQKRYAWNQYYAWYRNTASTLVQATTPVWLISSISECRTLASCAGTSDETKTTFTYGTSGTANNLLPTQITVAAGDGSISATTTYVYDANGDKLSEDGPLSGSADTTVWKYDVMRRVVGAIGPDPDGGGPLKHRATRNTYDAAGRLVRVERGTTLGPSDSDWSAFSVLQSVETDYDALDREIKVVLKAGSTVYAVTQHSYDSFGRLECTAVRMNPAAFGSVPANACTLGAEGTQGPDRITRHYYDAAGQLIRTQVAVGTADAADDRTQSYTVNGRLATVADGENNLTTHEHDGHDRLAKTRYPVPTQGQLASSTTDYEQYGHDANGNVISTRRRDGQTIYSSFDALNRTTLKDLPSPEQDVTYGYDLQGRMLSATQGSAITSQGWDALGRMTSETNGGHTTGLLYDPAGRLTRITHSDGFYAIYAYNTVDLTSILESGATSLVSYTHDDLGRRTILSRANGTTTSYSFDPVSRLASFSQDLAGTANDVTVSGIAYSPASQIVSLTRSNDAYAWTGHYDQDRPDTVNGLNQLTSAGTATVSHDARGNLTQHGTRSYGYTVENRLVSGPDGVSVAYDPLGRIAQVSQGTATTRFGHLGSRLIVERDGNGAILRRYVHGPGADEPVVWYEGAGTADKRYLHADERGSVIAVSDAAGAALIRNSYDEYGVPASTNAGRFQYTGQAWVPELGLAYYKARMYEPRLGRFLQTDPIGYEDDVNLYAYTRNDPLNLTDPSGRESYLVSRPLSFTDKANHNFIVHHAKGLGDPKATVRSFGDAGDGTMGEVTAATEGFSKGTYQTDRAAWESLGSEGSNATYRKIDAYDDAVKAYADAIPAGLEYKAVPEVAGGANSNSAAGAVATKADLGSTRVDNGKPQPGGGDNSVTRVVEEMK